MPVRLVVIDHYDSFTWNLVQYLEELGATCDVRPSDRTTPAEVLSAMPQGVVLSPGAGGPRDAGVTLDAIGDLSGKIPLLGVCLGHQAIGLAFGGEVRRAGRPMHGQASLIAHDGTGIFEGLPSPFLGARYHSLALDGARLPECLTVTAVADDGEVMGVRHRDLPLQGIQFHPESILSEHGKLLLQNWLESL